RDALARAERLRLAQRHDRSGAAGQRLAVALYGQLERKRTRLAALSQLFESLNYKSVLARGYAIVRDADGEPVSSAAAVQPAQALAIEFADGVVRTTADGPRPKRRSPLGLAQASLFDARG
ncbi:MAG: exodeoxyribonuclease VII large subunit, partial [Bradyrhizobium canariense]